MTNPIFLNSAILCILSLIVVPALAAIPDKDKVTCATKTPVTSALDISKLPASTLLWDCLELSSLPKADLLTLTGIAPKLSMQLSRANIERSDFEELQKKIQVELLVDSKKFGRTDLVELSKTGVKLTIYSDETIFNTIDYAEIAAAGAFTLFIRGQQFSFKEISELAQNSKIDVVMQGKPASMSEANLDELAKQFPNLKIIP